MAIGPDGKVTTTGLMNNTGNIPEAPDMSNLKPPDQPKQKITPATTNIIPLTISSLEALRSIK